jgi:MtN3 and saliva related transmembrane protein
MDLYTEVIGWFSATVLLLTLTRQVWRQWRERTAAGVSKWLFAGQLVASCGFVTYSFLVGNWVFVVTNILILITAIVGQVVVLRNKRRTAREEAGSGPAAAGAGS